MSNLIITRHGDYDKFSGELRKGEWAIAWAKVSEILQKFDLAWSRFWILTSPEQRAIETGEGIIKLNPNCFLLNPSKTDLVISNYPFIDWEVDTKTLSSQTQNLLEYLRKRIHEAEWGIVLIGHEPSIIWLSSELKLWLDRNGINFGNQLPVLTRI